MTNALFDFSVEQISSSKFINKVTIFTSHKSFEQDIFIKKISSQLPTLIINSVQIEFNGTNISLNLPIYKKMKNTKLFIALHDSVDPDLCLKHLYEIVNFIVYLSPITTRPMFLVVLFSKNLPGEENLKKFLSYGWSLKFLNLSIIKVNTHTLYSESMILSYNPFRQIYVNEQFNATTDIFPDKLNNMWGYRFNVLYYHKPPFFIITKDKKKGTENIQGISYSFLKILTNKMNFSLEMEKLNNTSNWSEMFKLFKKTNSKMSTVPVLVSVLNETDFLTGRIVIDQRFIMIVPVVTVLKVVNLYYLFIHLCYFVIIVMCFVATVYIFKFPSSNWKVLDIYQILLGVSLSMQPQKSTQRIVYFSLIIVSIKYSGDIFANMTGIKVKHEEKLFDTFDEIIESKIPVYMSEIFQNEVYDKTDEITRSLKMKSRIYKNFDECLYTLRTTKNAICITNDIYGQFVFKTHNSLVNGKVLNPRNYMKLAKPHLYHDKTTFFYETASPFVQKIERICLRIYDSGLSKSWRVKSIFNYAINESEDEARKKYFFLWEVITIATIGYIISGGVFLTELVLKYLKNY
jgi:hypothetical protein